MHQSPLAVWLGEVGMTQAQLATLTDVQRPDVCRSARGHIHTPRRLAEFLQRHAPEVLLRHDQYVEAQRKLLLARVAA